MLILCAIVSSLLLCVQAAGIPSEKFECHTGAVDLVLVMDDSESVKPPNFKLGLEAAIELTQSLDIGVGDASSRVGFVTFSDKASTSFNLNTKWNNAQVEKAIGQVVYSAGQGTDIAKGMDMAIKQVFQPNARPVPRIMIIITDGQDSSDVHAELSQANEQGIRTYAIGVGNDVDSKQLTKATGNANRVYIVSSYADIATALSKICNEIESSVAPPTVEPHHTHNPRSCGCEEDEDYNNVWLDIIFVIDASDSISDYDFENTRALLLGLADTYTIGTGPASAPHKYTRVGIVLTAEKAVRFANLTSYKSGAEMQDDVVKRLKKMDRTFMADLGMKAAADMFEEAEAAGERMNVRKVVVLFSSSDIICEVHQKSARGARLAAGPEQNTICQLVSQMKSDRVAIITVASRLAGEVNYPDINIADDCDRVMNSDQMVGTLIKRICMANCYCLYPYTQFVTQNKCERYGECVYVHEMALSYKSAEATCKRGNETLTDILSEDKDTFLKELHLETGFFPYWVGAKHIGGGMVKWDSGSESAAGDWFHWEASQPDPSKGECIVQKQSKGFKTNWFSEKCGSLTPTHFFSCQKPSCSANNYCDFF